MADTPTTGALAPSSTPAIRRVITSTFRTRRNHGTFLVGGHVVAVYSRPARFLSSEETPGLVSITAGHSQLMVDGAMKPEQARGLARALHAAANAAELVGGAP